MPLDPDFAHMLRQLERGGWTSIAQDPPAAARERFRELALARQQKPGYEPEPVARVQDEEMPGADRSLLARIYEPAAEQRAVIVWMHGGGWVLGDLETTDETCRLLANSSAALVVSLDYRRAPENPYPAALDDTIAALRWARARWPERSLIAAGESAGGGLAAGAALRARDEGWDGIDAQLLVCPMLDPLLTQPSLEELAEGYFLTRDDILWFYAHYLGDGRLRPARYANLLGAEDMAGLPPAIITSAEFDPLRDEAGEYAARIRAAGGKAELIEGPGLIHGYFSTAALVPSAARAFAVVIESLRDLIARAGAA